MAHALCMMDISGYVTLIAFPLQKWLHERLSMLRYTYIACLVESSVLFLSVRTNKSNLQVHAH
jgi:hypothetical protein